MTIYATGNPVGSTNPKELIDNSQNFDYLILGPLLSYPDRLGVNRLSWKGIETAFAAAQAARAEEYSTDKLERDTEFDEDQTQRGVEFDADQLDREIQYNFFMENTGYEEPIPYAPGILLDRTTKTVTYLGLQYRVKTQFMPLSTTNWAFDGPKLLLVGDDSLRQALASLIDPAKGAGQIGYMSALGAAVGRALADKLSESVSIYDYMTAAEIADANSVTPVLDHSAAFTNMFSAMVLAPRAIIRANINPVLGYYRAKEIAVPTGKSMYGFFTLPYTPFAASDMVGSGSAIVMIAGAASLFTWASRHTIEGIGLHGLDRTQDCFKATGASAGAVRATRCGFYRFNRGIGNNAYLGASSFTECAIACNNVGISNVVDSRFVGNVINANEGVGVSLPTGANDNTFIGNKCEWNNTDNWSFFGSVNNIIMGGVTDRAGRHNFNVGSGTRVIINGGISRRAGRSSPGYNLFGENFSKLTVSNLQTDFGANDDGSGTVSPSTCVYLRAANGICTMTGVDMTGTTGLALVIESGTTFDYLAIQACPGAQDRFIRPGDASGSVSVPAGATVNIPVKMLALPTFGRSAYRVAITGRNTFSGGTMVGAAVLTLQRESGNASAFTPVLDFGSTGFGVAITDVISISFANVAADGTTADIAIKSTSGNAFAINYVFSRVV